MARAPPPICTTARPNAGLWPSLTIPPTAPSRPMVAASTSRPSRVAISSETIVPWRGK